MKCLACVAIIAIAADLQAQLIYKCKFSAVEGYTNGWAIGQPSIGNKWINANYNLDYLSANGLTTYSPINNGAGSTNEDGSIFYNASVINSTAPGGGQLKIAADNNQNDLGEPPAEFTSGRGTYFFKMDFPTQRRGPVTVTWDWQFFHTNAIPADYDPTNNNYNAQLPGYDQGFTLSDYANCVADGNDGNPNWKYNELGTPCRLSTFQDCRYNAQGACGGGGEWNNFGPQFKDGKVVHMKLVGYGTNAPADYVGTFEAFAQRDGEDLWQTAFHQDTVVNWIKNGVEVVDATVLASGYRRCPGETDPNSGLNCIMLWLNGQTKPKYTLVSNIRIVGPDPVAVPNLKIEKVGADVKMTFDGWLEAADVPQGPWTTVAVQSPYQIAAGAAKKFYRANN